MRCHNANDNISDQGFKCKEFEEPYFVFNTALNAALFGNMRRPIDRPSGQITNTEQRDPLVEWIYQFSIAMRMERSRSNHKRAADDDEKGQASRNNEQYEDDSSQQPEKRRRV